MSNAHGLLYEAAEPKAALDGPEGVCQVDCLVFLSNHPAVTFMCRVRDEDVVPSLRGGAALA